MACLVGVVDAHALEFMTRPPGVRKENLTTLFVVTNDQAHVATRGLWVEIGLFWIAPELQGPKQG